MEAAVLLAAGLAVAWANGANDNFKGVATLYGSGVLGHRRALALATVSTFAGSLASLGLATGLIAAFRGQGLVPDALAGEPRFMAAVGLAAAATVLAAARLGLPISTTHALLGGLVGAGIARAGAEVDLGRLTAAFAAPLLISPLLASIVAGSSHSPLRSLRRSLGLDLERCVCVEPAAVPLAPARGDVAAAAPSLRVIVDRSRACDRHPERPLARVDAARAVDLAHMLSAAAVSFARGVSDTPKIVPLLLAVDVLAPGQGILFVGTAIALGGLLAGRRVAETMSRRITALDPAHGLMGNLTTAALVIGASRYGLPVSTTHVSCGALFGIGAATGHLRWGVVRTILLAWVTTVPCAAALAALLSLL